MPTNKPRISIAVDDELLTKIDDFRYSHRIPSRAAATIRLIERGLSEYADDELEHKDE